eukprot:1159956-Pelagomonas_calceolata.AAC.2
MHFSYSVVTAPVEVAAAAAAPVVARGLPAAAEIKNYVGSENNTHISYKKRLQPDPSGIRRD